MDINDLTTTIETVLRDRCSFERIDARNGAHQLAPVIKGLIDAEVERARVLATKPVAKVNSGPTTTAS